MGLLRSSYPCQWLIDHYGTCIPVAMPESLSDSKFPSPIQERKSEVNSPERNRIVTPWPCLLYLILCDLMDFSLPGSSVLGISQARLLEWVAISFTWGAFQSRDRTQVSCLSGGFFSTESAEKLPFRAQRDAIRNFAICP